MGGDILSVLRLFAAFAGVAEHLVDSFAERHPELVRPPAGPPAPDDAAIDAEVDRLIEEGEV